MMNTTTFNIKLMLPSRLGQQREAYSSCMAEHGYSPTEPLNGVPIIGIHSLQTSGPASITSLRLDPRLLGVQCHSSSHDHQIG